MDIGVLFIGLSLFKLCQKHSKVLYLKSLRVSLIILKRLIFSWCKTMFNEGQSILSKDFLNLLTKDLENQLLMIFKRFG